MREREIPFSVAIVLRVLPRPGETLSFIAYRQRNTALIPWDKHISNFQFRFIKLQADS